jgi:hypothetical protein
VFFIGSIVGVGGVVSVRATVTVGVGRLVGILVGILVEIRVGTGEKVGSATTSCVCTVS